MQPRDGSGPLSRREFVRRSAAAATGAALAGTGLWSGLAGAQAGNGLIYRHLGKSGLVVPPISMGTVGGWGEAGKSIEADEAAIRTFAEALHYGLDQGLTMIHTCSSYNDGKALVAIGEVMKDRRDEVVLCLKQMPDAELPRCLEKLQCGGVDVLLPDRTQLHLITEETVPALYQAAKEQGLTKLTGFASHQSMPDILAASLEMACYDAAIMFYNPAAQPAINPVLARAKEQGMGLLAMKTCADVPGEQWEEVMGAIIAAEQVDSLVRTVAGKADVDRWLGVAQRAVAEAQALRESGVLAALQAAGCAMCGACSGSCPRGLNAAQIQRYAYYVEQGWTDHGRDLYAALSPARQVPACADCGTCERGCPQRLPVRERLQRAHRMLT